MSVTGLWPDSRIAILRRLWLEGVGTAEMGRRLGCSKNAIVGKVHRLELAPRPSPIKGERRVPVLAAPRPVPAPPPPPVVVMVVVVPPVPVFVPPPQVFGPPPPPPEAEIVFLPRLSRGSCLWLEGQRRHYRACAAPVVRGSYCVEHAKLAFERQ